MYAINTKRYGYGPIADNIRATWSDLDVDKNGYITQNEFSYRAKIELERILTQPDYIPIGYTPGAYSPYRYGYMPYGSLPYPPVAYPPVPYPPTSYPPTRTIPVPVYPPVIIPIYTPRIVSFSPFW